MNGEVKKPSFLVYYDNEVIVVRLSDEEAGKLFKSLFPYGRDAIKPDFDESPALAMAFDILSMAIDRDREKYVKRCEANRENGRKGGLAKAINRKQVLPNGKQGLANLGDMDNKNTMCKADALALFERLWKLYPVKKGKGQVSLTAKQRLLKVGYEEMARAISRYKADLEKDRGWRKPQNGSTFFNSGYIDYLDKNYGDAADAEPVLEEDAQHSSSGKQISKSKEEVEAEIYKIVHNRIRQEALERYHDKIHELIRMCCPLESFTQEQIDYMWREWGMEPAPKVDTLIPPDESNFSFWDHRLYSK